jgi:hypothetical protein
MSNGIIEDDGVLGDKLNKPIVQHKLNELMLIVASLVKHNKG